MGKPVGACKLVDQLVNCRVQFFFYGHPTSEKLWQTCITEKSKEMGEVGEAQMCHVAHQKVAPCAHPDSEK